MRQSSVLVVEDNDTERTELAEMLEANDFRVERTPFGKAAVTKAKEDNQFLVLMDLSLERGSMDGIQAIKAINFARPNLPVAILSAYSRSAVFQSRAQAAQISVIAWLEKPYDEEELLHTVARAWIHNQYTSIRNVASKYKLDLSSLSPPGGSGNGHGNGQRYNSLHNTVRRFDEPSVRLNVDAFQRAKPELLLLFRHGFVAFLDGEFVGHHSNRDALIDSVCGTIAPERRRSGLLVTRLDADREVGRVWTPRRPHPEKRNKGS